MPDYIRPNLAALGGPSPVHEGDLGGFDTGVAENPGTNPGSQRRTNIASDLVTFEIDRAVGLITLNRPEARNAFSMEMLVRLAAALDECRSSEVRSVLLTGSGEAFCSGADVREFTAQLDSGGPAGISDHLRDLAGFFHDRAILPIRQLEKPVVAGVNGVAAGGGFSLMAACDLRVAADSARFLMAYANIGATADGGSTFFLPRLIGTSRAMELYLSNQPLSAEAALSIGLVSQVFPAADFSRLAMETALRLAQGAHHRLRQGQGHVRVLLAGGAGDPVGPGNRFHLRHRPDPRLSRWDPGIFREAPAGIQRELTPFTLRCFLELLQLDHRDAFTARPFSRTRFDHQGMP